MIVFDGRTDVIAEDRGDGVTELHFRPETRIVRQQQGVDWRAVAIGGALFILIIAFWTVLLIIARGVV